MMSPTAGPIERPGAARRTLLVVTYFFPPTGGVGVQRTLKFIRYLRLEGWRSVVVTPAEPAYPLRDPDLLAQVPEDVTVIRTTCPEPAGLPGSLRERAGRQGRGPEHGAITSGAGPVPPFRRQIRSLMRTGARWWTRLVRLVLFPDDQILWWPFAVMAIGRSRERPTVDAVLSSSPPFTAHVIGGSLAKMTGRPWVADFRDPFVGNAFAIPRSSLARRLEGWLERRVVGRADAVIVASPSMERAFSERYPAQVERIECIPNGYDRADLVEIEPVARDSALFTIVYGGSVYGTSELGLFLDGVERLLARDPALRRRLRVEFVGRINLASQAVATRYGSPERLGGIVSYTGFLPRREALGRMRSANALLQLVADDPGKEAFVGTKTLEALGFDLPVLAVVPRGDARALLEELNWGFVADPEPESIADALERLIDAPKPSRVADPEGRYDRASQARRLAAILDALTA